MKKLKETKNFGAFLDRTLRRIRLDMGRRLMEQGVEITPEQWIILSSLYERNGQSQTELGDDSFKNPPTVSRIIDLLCKKELTERRSDSGDRRRHKIYLTTKGQEIVEPRLSWCVPFARACTITIRRPSRRLIITPTSIRMRCSTT